MKRRVLSFITVLALCLNLFPAGALAADEGTDDGLCPHHPAHTDACGYISPVSERECTHSHDDGCYTEETDCIHEHTAACYPGPDGASGTDEPALCAHVCTQDSGCVTRVLACLHEHGDACGYAEGNPGAPCTFVCPICPIEDLISKLPARVSAHNMEQVQAQLSEIYALYDELTSDEQQQVDLSPCAALLDQIDGMGSAVLDGGYNLAEDETFENPFVINVPATIETNGHTWTTGKGECAIRVTGTGKLYLTGGGKVISRSGIGVEVQSGGFLSIVEPTTYIKGMTLGLDIASGAEVHLSGGTYEGSTAAIRTADGDFGALLEDGCAYYDEGGNWIPPENMATAKKVIVKQCTDHSKECVPNRGLPTHNWTCSICGATGTEECTFGFAQGTTGTCGSCNNEITVTVDRDSLKVLAFDETVKPENGAVTVRVKDATADLVLDTDYTVSYETRANVGEASFTVTVTVTGKAYNGIFTEDYTFTEAELETPVLEWDTTSISVPVAVDYDGSPVEKDDLPPVIINVQTSAGVDLHDRLRYSHKAQGNADAYTDGLPTNAGTYDVVVTLPEGLDYQAASSEAITLVVHPIDPIDTAPAPAKPTYNGAAQELVTRGALKPVAMADGLEIQFAVNENGPYSITIPTGTSAGTNYSVWYKVVGLTGNYIEPAPNPAEVSGVEIQRKPITPDVTLSDYTYLYDGGVKQPKVTVKDGDTVLPTSEYSVAYENNKDVSTEDNPAKVVVTDKTGGNYDITTVEVPFEITIRQQETLSITQKPNTVTYGDQFTLGTSGGSGDGEVTWAIIAGSDVATVNPKSGQLTIIGDGEATVRATKSGKDPVTGVTNHEDAIATWPFTASKKAVTATVTADDKPYDTNTNATVHAVVKEGVLSGDEIIITGLTGTFDDKNAGVDKPVTVNISGANITGRNSEHYVVSYSSTTVKATIHKAIAKITTPPAAATLTYNGTEQELIATGAVVDPASVPVEYALSEDGLYSTDSPKGTNAGEYTVWYRIQETANYTGEAPQSVKATIAKKSVVPVITLDETHFVYDGTAKEPVVTLKEADGTTVIPAGEYTVAYSNNINVGTATVTVTAKADGNYSFAARTENFTIGKKQAEVLTAPEAAGAPLTFNTRAQKLVTPGAGTGGTMVYSVDGENGTYLPTIPTKTDAENYTVHYKVQGDTNHSDSEVGSVSVTIAPKPVTATVELRKQDNSLFASCVYNGSAQKVDRVIVKDGSTVIDDGEYTIIYSDNINAGTAKVNITDNLAGNYTVTGSATFVIEKADIVFAPAPSAAVITYDGKAHELLEPGTTSGGEVLYALDSATSKYDDAIPTATEAGEYTVYYKVVGDKNHNDLTVRPVPVTIKRKPLTAITIELTPDSFEYDGKVKMPTITVKDGKTVLPEEEYTWTCNETSPTNQGTYTITISDALNGNYDLTGVTANTATFSIGKTAQTELVIEGKPNLTIYGDTFTLTTSGGSSSGAVTWGATGPATVDAATGAVVITGVGEVTITATNPGDQNYLPVSDQWTFTAAPKPVTASVVVGNRAYDGTTNAAVTSASITTINSDTVTIDPASITAAFDTPGVGTGKTVTLDTSKVKVTGADAAKYDISYPDTVTADITRATTKVTTAPEKIDPLTYNGQPQELITAGVTNVGFLVYSLDGKNFSPEVPTGTGAGTYTIHYRVDGTSDYTGVAGASITVTIGPKSITPEVELSESSFLYDGTKKEPKITVKDDETVIDPKQYTVTWANDDPTVTGGLLTAAGTYTANITNVANGNYLFTATAQIEITAATQGSLKIIGKPEHVYYGDTVTTLEATGGTGNGTMTWSIEPGSADAEIDPAIGHLTVKDIGAITVKATRTVPNYAPATDTWTFTVEPKPVTAEVTITGRDYDGTTAVDNAAITAAVKAGDLVNAADSITISGLTGAYEDANAGTGKTVTLNSTGATVTGDTAKYAVSYPDTAKGTINPRRVDVTVTLSGNDLQTDNTATPPAYSYNYDGTEKNPNVTVTANDNNAVLTASDYNVNITDNKNVGNATVTVTEKAGGNYTFPEKEVKFAIKKASAAWNTPPQAKILTYDGTKQELVTAGSATGGTVVYSLEQNGTYEEAIPKETAARTYIVYYMVKGDDNHEDTAPGHVSVTISSREITPAITLDRVSYEYDGNPQTPGVTVKDGTNTIVASEYSVSYRDNINAGTATVIVSDNNGGNYIVNGTATFEITKKAPTLTTNPAKISGLQYNGGAQELVTAGVCHEGTVEYSLNGGNYSTAIPVGTAVGTYTIDYKVRGDANHSDTGPVRLAVEIGKNKVTNPTITLSSTQFTYNGSPQEPAITVLDNNQREIPKHEYTVTITGTNGNNMVDVDTYTVTITTPSTSNYDMTNDGTVNVRTFKIVPADQESISITGTQAQVHYGDTISLGVTGGTGVGTIAWEIRAKDNSAVSSTISATGLLTVTDVGGPYIVTVTRTKPNYGTVSAEWEFSAGRKPVTAEVTIAPKPFDGTPDVNDTAITAVVNARDLVSGDSISINGLKGTYDSASVGTKTVTLNSGNVTVSGTNWEKYDIAYPKTATGAILSAAATVDTAPKAVDSLIYDASEAQELVTAGTVTGGTMVYSLDGTNFTAAIPKTKEAGKHTVWYKAQGDSNHTDSEAESIEVTIKQRTVASNDVQIELTPPSAKYDGNVKRPTVTVRDKENNVIPESEYKVTYVSDSGENWTDKGTYKVKVENITGGNYVVETATANFEINTSAQAPLEIVNKPGFVYYGNTFTLSAVGGSGSEKVTWSSSNEDIAHIDANGFVTIKGVGSATITAAKTGGGNYDTVTATYPLNALKKPITAIVTADDKVYDTKTDANLHVTWEKGALVGDDEIKIETLTGAFADEHVGTNKKVTFTCTFVADTTYAKYDITVPPNTTASISKADATVAVLTANDRVYDGTSQALVTGGNANTTLYSGSRDGVYTATVPTETNAGTYTVWYKEKGDANHNDSEPQSIQVTISQKTLTADALNTTLSGNDLQTDTINGTYYYTYDGSEKKPSVIIKDGSVVIPASEYTVGYSNNKNVGDATATITNSEGGNYTVNGSVTFEIRKGSAELATYPQAKDLTYTGQMQELVAGGTATGGHIEYALDGVSCGEDIPKATFARTYTVTYKAVGDDNHEDSTKVGSVTVTIKPKEVVSPKVAVSGTYTYDGSAKEPGTANVKVEDGGNTIPSTEYTLSYRDNVNAGTATVIITNANGGNYIVNGTGTFEIAKGAASVAAAPKGLKNLPYNGTEQALIEAGTASNGTMVYSLSETGEYTPAIPTGKAVGTYTVWYKAQGDSNHNDSAAQSVTASIAKNTVTESTIQVTPESATYNGEKQEFTIAVKDDNGFVIDGSEYTVAYSGDLINVGKYTLTITGVADGNYTFTPGKNTADFEILPADQKPLTITGTRERVYYGDSIQLGTTGGDGTIAWTVSDSSIARITNGLLEITGVGSVTVTATSTKTGYADQTATWALYAEKKPVTAVVTAEAKTYDRNTTATVTAVLNTSDLVDGDVVKITLAGSFEDPNAGTGKKVSVDSSNPQFSADSTGQENYLITYPDTTTASIFKADIDTAKVTPPTAAADLEYTGLPLTLVDTAGSSTDGTMEYSLDNKTYSASLPTGTGAGDYEVWYRVKGDSNHNDTAGTTLGTVTIAPQAVTNLTIEFNPSGASYDGKEHKPTVTVKDNNKRVIPATEYTVDYGTGDWTKAGDYEVKVTAKGGGNYTFSEAKKTFTILVAGQSPLSITNKPGKVQYGDSFTLSAVGGSITGAVAWESSDPQVASINDSGLVTVHKSGSVTITAKKVADGNYGEVSDTWAFSAEKKPVTPIVTARDREYNGTDNADLVVRWKDGDLLNGDTLTLTLNGTFGDANVGTNKEVAITGTKPDSDKYEITLPTSTTASITPKAASLTGATNPELTYDGNPQPLVTGVTATNGTLAYSRNGTYYTLNVPKETNAGTYTVWYKAQADGNFKDSPAVCVEVTIKPKDVTNPVIELSSETFDYDGTAKKPDVVVKDGSTVIPASEYDVSYSNNVQIGTNATVTITAKTGGNYNVSGSKTFTIKAGSAALKDAPKPNDLTYNGFKQELVTPGTAVNGKVVYSTTENGSYSTSIPGETNAGVYQIWYKVQGDNGAGDTEPKSVIVEIKQKLAYPTVKLDLASNPLPYTGTPQEPSVTVSVNEERLDENDYTVTYSNNIEPGRAEVTVQSTGSGNYQFKDTTAFYIAKSKAAFTVPPKGRTDLVYTGEPQELIEELTGISLEGIVVYSQNAVTYSAEIPTGTKVRTYTIFAKVLGDSKHEDSDPITISTTISKNIVNDPTVTLSQNSFKYDGSEHKPTVTVTDDNGNVIPAGEYTATYSNNINVGTATVTIKNRGTNYQLDTTAKFQIVDGSQPILTITGKRDSVVYGDTLYLGTTGGTGAVTWSSSDTNVAAIDSSTGVVTTKKSGSVTIRAASGGLTDTWTFTVAPKPVTAVVTAASKPYDGNNTATLTVTISNGLVPGDIISAGSVTAQGHFADVNVGENMTVVIDSLTVPAEVSAKYDISWPATTTASITPKPAAVKDHPQPVTGLTYTGSPQALVTAGAAEGGELVYSVDGGSYSYNLPTAVNAGSYTVRYKVEAGDDNHKDSAVMKVENVTIGVNTDKPTVLCTPNTIPYDGTEKTPTIVVRDSQNRIIPESEYTIELPANRIEVGEYEVTVTDKTGGNYEFTTPVTGKFKIVASSQNPLSIITSTPTNIHYGDSFRLSAMGGSGSGAIQWSIKERSGVATIDSDGVVTVTGTGGFTVEAYREAADGYDKSNTASVVFEAKPKPVTPVVAADDKPYDGKTDATLKASWKSGDLVGSDTITLTVGGAFATADAGTGKRVDITSHIAAGDAATKYMITWPDSVTASIYKVDAKLATVPTGPDLTYNGSAQPLVTGGTTENGIGVVEYSTSEKGAYSTAIPTGTNAGTYTVWYKVADSVNYTGIDPASIEVEIKKMTPKITASPTASGNAGQQLSDIKLNGGAIEGNVTGKFTWKDGNIQAENGVSYDVIFTPDPDYIANYNTATIQVQVTLTATSGISVPPPVSTNTTPPQPTAQDGTASAVVSAADGDKLVQEAVENQSQTIVIKPEITGDVTKAQVSIPASTVGQIQSQTNASLTVSTPIADAAIPREALDALASAGGDISVTAEQEGQSVTFTLAAGGETVEQIPGGLTLTIPVEDAGPGTVAVLVHEDGAREVIQRSIVEDGRMNIPLDGSATVEIVDNGRAFSDVPAANWASEAVTFAAARELFSGTSETTFSPDETMSRAMLATVLYRLEGQPEQTAASAYSDVSSDAWYADSVAWAVENGIASGYGDGQFGPNDSVTREQFVVMLWRYVGSPKASRRDLEFADADRVSDYAQEALCWAVENGVLNGNDSGQLVPGGTATRAEAAQMLKNFMENI